MRVLDTYVGRSMLSLLDSPSGAEDWRVSLDGGVFVINKDPLNPKPVIPNITGLIFVTVILSDTTTQMVLWQQNPDGTMLAEWRVPFTPSEYMIFDPDTQPEAWYPQRTPVMIVKASDADES